MRASRTRHFSNYSLNLSKLALTGPARTWRPTRPRCRNRHVVLGQHGLEITHELNLGIHFLSILFDLKLN